MNEEPPRKGTLFSRPILSRFAFGFATEVFGVLVGVGLAILAFGMIGILVFLISGHARSNQKNIASCSGMVICGLVVLLMKTL